MSEISVLEDTELAGQEQGTLKKKNHFSLRFLLLLKQSPILVKLMLPLGHSHPAGTGSGASKEGVQAVYAAATCQRGCSSHPTVLRSHATKTMVE